MRVFNLHSAAELLFSYRMGPSKPLKSYLLTAGPTPVPERLALAMAQPIIFHRSAAFTELLKETVAGLQWVFQTTQPVILATASGSGGMEAAVINFLSPGDKALCVRGGRFGERWTNLCNVYGIQAINVDVEWGQAVDPAKVKEVLDAHPDIKALLCTASESSTGVAHPVRELSALCSGRDTLCIVDAISAVGAFDVPQDKWGIDVLVGASQKAMMLPPGLAFLGVSEKAWARAEQARCPRFYFDLRKLRKSQEKGETTWTPAVTIMAGLREALQMMKAEGLERIFERHLRLADATRQACAAIGCDLFAVGSPSPSVSAVKVPAGIDGSAVVQLMRNRYGITISGGQEHLKGKIFRIAHMGYFGPFDIILAISGLEMALAEVGYSFELGAGVRKAEAILKTWQ